MKPRISIPRETLDPEPAPVAVATATARNGHDTSGRFAAGNKAASGRKSRAAWREAFYRACSDSDLEAIVRRAVADAKGGDARAREWIGTFALQKPPRLIDLTTREFDGGGEPSSDVADEYYL